MKRAIVTGSAGLIGAALCRTLAGAGWEVAGFDLAPGTPSEALAQACDVSDEAAVAGAVAALGWDRLDLLVNNAGRTGGFERGLGATTLSDWRAMIDSHLTGAFLMSRAVLPLMAQGGAIVNMASTRAVQSEPGDFCYAAAKGGIVSLTRALAVALGPAVRVNAIAPGWITDAEVRPEDGAQHPAGRVGRPQDIAQAVLYLAQAGFVTGELLRVDGGMTRKMVYLD